MLSANGVVINPSAVTVAPSGAVLGSVGLDISPTLITVGAVDRARAALGFSIAPSLIKVCSDSLSVHAHVRWRAPGMPTLHCDKATYLL